MAKISEVITKLQRLEKKHGDVNLVIYKSFDKKTIEINEDEIYFDEKLEDVYIGIYN